MHGASVEWYLEIIKKDIVQKMNNDFTGNVEFRVNFIEGALVNINRTVKDGFQFKNK